MNPHVRALRLVGAVATFIGAVGGFVYGLFQLPTWMSSSIIWTILAVVIYGVCYVIANDLD